MTDSDHAPDAGGAMTGATGHLTPDGPDEEFVPAERRAVDQPERSQTVITGARRRAAANRSPVDRPGSLDERPLSELAPNDRDGGYGSEHGLAPNDPAYDFEERSH
jgi:hypothetical protein